MLFSEANRVARENGESETEVIVRTFNSLDGIGDNLFVSRTRAQVLVWLQPNHTLCENSSNFLVTCAVLRMKVSCTVFLYYLNHCSRITERQKSI